MIISIAIKHMQMHQKVIKQQTAQNKVSAHTQDTTHYLTAKPFLISLVVLARKNKIFYTLGESEFRGSFYTIQRGIRGGESSCRCNTIRIALLDDVRRK